jgi:hypothetical protein
MCFLINSGLVPGLVIAPDPLRTRSCGEPSCRRSGEVILETAAISWNVSYILTRMGGGVTVSDFWDGTTKRLLSSFFYNLVPFSLLQSLAE